MKKMLSGLDFRREIRGWITSKRYECSPWIVILIATKQTPPEQKASAHQTARKRRQHPEG